MTSKNHVTRYKSFIHRKKKVKEELGKGSWKKLQEIKFIWTYSFCKGLCELILVGSILYYRDHKFIIITMPFDSFDHLHVSNLHLNHKKKRKYLRKTTNNRQESEEKEKREKKYISNTGLCVHVWAIQFYVLVS